MVLWPLWLMLSQSIFLSFSASSNDISTAEKMLPEITYQQVDLTSTVLNEQREILIKLPNGYHESEQRYPVIYLLDGNRHFQHAIMTEDALTEEGLIPHSIIVAITNREGARARDLVREQQTFRQFVTAELRNYIDSHYRTLPINTLFGHSMAGYFTVATLTSQSDAFDHYITASPVLQMRNQEQLAKYKQLSDSNKKQGAKSLYLSMADTLAEGKRASSAMNNFVALLSAQSDANFNWHYQLFEEQVHMTTPFLSLYQGLVLAFSDFQTPDLATASQYREFGGFKGLLGYYQQRAKKYFQPVHIPEDAIRQIANALVQNGEHSVAIALLEQAQRLYPKSLMILNTLARAFERNQQIEQALSIFEHAKALAEAENSLNLAYFERQVKRLRAVATQ